VRNADVTPAKAGVQGISLRLRHWMPAFAGMTLVACAGGQAFPDEHVGAGAPDAPDPAEAADAQDRMAYDIAESLVAEVGPRFAGTEGDRKAVEWALQKLNVLGFENVRAEPVTVPRWQRGTIKVELTAPAARTLDAVALGGSVATPLEGIEAVIVPVATVEALEQVPAAKVKGKIVFFTRRLERTRDGADYGKAVPIRTKGASAAARKGAKAVLIRSVGTDAGNGPHTGMVRYEDGVAKIPAAALATKDADVLEQALAGGKAVRARIVITSRDAGMAQSANVIGEMPGTTDEIVLLGAHLDSWDMTPGANDDAAGVGIVIAAAHRLSGSKPRRTVRVVLFANEEFGLSGAKAYVQAHAAELPRHAVALEADSGSGAVWRLSGGLAAADWPWAQALAAQLKLEVKANDQDGHADLTELRKHGVPEIIPTHDAGAYFDVHHTRDDTVDKLDREGLKQASETFAALALAAAQRLESFGRAPVLPEKRR